MSDRSSIYLTRLIEENYYACLEGSQKHHIARIQALVVFTRVHIKEHLYTVSILVLNWDVVGRRWALKGRHNQ